jgi:hypothetical protein
MFHFYQARIQPGSASVCAHAGPGFSWHFGLLAGFCHALFFDSQKGCASGFPAGRVSKMETIVCNLFQVK